MSTARSIEDRVSALEREMAELNGNLVRERKEGSWIEKITGRFKDDPVIDEIVRLGAEIRRAERTSEVDEQSH